MKIEYARRKTTTFECIEDGQCFLVDNLLCMKLANPECDCGEEDGGGDCCDLNAVNISNGDKMEVSNLAEVIPVNAKIVVED